jgi:hypothetical protein
MQQQAPQHKIRKSPLMRNALKVHLVLRVGLHAQRDGEDELADAGAEAGEEGVEWLLFPPYISCVPNTNIQSEYHLSSTQREVGKDRLGV